MAELKIFLKVIYYLVLTVTLIYSLYFSLIGILGLLKKNKNKIRIIDKKNRFAIIIAARNEEMVIGNLIDSLKKSSYPDKYFDVYVVPNNCSDDTKKVALEHGAKVLDCTVLVKTKSDVLRFAFDKLGNDNYDAYIVFEADNIADKNFISNMNDVLNNGYNIAQGIREAKNPNDSWVSGSYAIYYMLSNLFINYSRFKLGTSCSINGTGFMVSKKLIDKVGFNTKTLTEDIEFSSICALNNEKIYFAMNAITYDEHPDNFMVSIKQRKRWSAGTIHCMKLYSGKLLKGFFKTGNIALLDMFFVFMAPIIQILSFLNILFIPVFRILNVSLFGFDLHLILTGFIGSIISYLVTTVFTIIVVIAQGKKVIPLLKGILLFPLFILSWVPLHIYCFIREQNTWDEIKHSKNIRIDDMESE